MILLKFNKSKVYNVQVDEIGSYGVDGIQMVQGSEEQKQLQCFTLFKP
jgi:hypothetical protein